ncbi:hypothetical protein NLY43_22355 [Mesorhizobium sp. C416B]|uniref:hypothetical protein n=1 Tax=unclassified Mesorhizobium TaxID=325217 RepID=UPI0012EB7F1E|nr:MULTISPECIES: hypothetical protein [unclassified Mesorhizobium]WJI61348.1 hypothetical protein NLY43_22355 [Mesorhizobium sp. C416B]
MLGHIEIETVRRVVGGGMRIDDRFDPDTTMVVDFDGQERRCGMTTSSDGENARDFLDSLRRGDLSALLVPARTDYGIGPNNRAVVVVRAPHPFAEALSGLPEQDRKRIAEAILSRRPDLPAPDDIIVKQTGDPLHGPITLLPDLLIHREMMIAVATGARPIQEVEDYYGARQARLIQACAAAGIPYENPHEGLWDWYRFWKDSNLATYAERRGYVRKLFAGPIASAAGRVNNPGPVVEREPTGWERVDRSLGRARTGFSGASVEEDWQAVGLVCREVLISLGQAVYVDGVHEPEDKVKPSPTDAKRMLEAYVRHTLPGDGYKEVRTHARAAVDLAVHLQHRRTATRQMAALCLEATSSAVAVVAIIAGQKV